MSNIIAVRDLRSKQVILEGYNMETHDICNQEDADMVERGFYIVLDTGYEVIAGEEVLDELIKARTRRNKFEKMRRGSHE